MLVLLLLLLVVVVICDIMLSRTEKKVRNSRRVISFLLVRFSPPGLAISYPQRVVSLVLDFRAGSIHSEKHIIHRLQYNSMNFSMICRLQLTKSISAPEWQSQHYCSSGSDASHYLDYLSPNLAISDTANRSLGLA